MSPLTPTIQNLARWRAIRSPERPVLEPRQGERHWWEKLGVFNPGVAEYQGKVILLYRAYDNFRLSRLGYAESGDGVDFEQRDTPAIDAHPDDAFERMGIEDPRITQIGSTYYIIHTSASYHRAGQPSDVDSRTDTVPWRIRIGMHTTEDFNKFKHWGVILPDIPAKNACLLPATKHDGFGLYYREHTAQGEVVKLAYTKDFLHWHDTIEIPWPNPQSWQSRKFGLGSPPLITPYGWIMITHAIDDSGVYRLGLAQVDPNSPERITWETKSILQPDTPYEKEGYIPNVVYTCGALWREQEQEIWIYYGAADRVIGRAILPFR